MKTAIVKFDNGDSITTDINGTEEEIKSYYSIGKQFNLGCVDDVLAKVILCEVKD